MLARKLNIPALLKLATEAERSIAGFAICLAKCPLGELEAVKESIHTLGKFQPYRWRCLEESLNIAITTQKQLDKENRENQLLERAQHFVDFNVRSAGPYTAKKIIADRKRKR